MKSKNVRTCVGRGLWLVILLLSGRAWAGDTYWQHDPAVAGDWLVPANWTAGLPTGDDNAYVDNGGTVQIAAGLAKAYRVYLGHAAGASGTVELSGGELLLHKPDSWYADLYVGYYGMGLFMQTGGINTAEGGLSLGSSEGGSGTYELSGGRVRSGEQWIGRDGTGHFIQTGGINAVAGTIELAGGQGSHGTYELSGGRVRSARQEIGYGGAGQFIQTGGTNAVAKTLHLAGRQGSHGTYELSGGKLRVMGSQYLGYYGTGVFAQTGGTNKVSDGLVLGMHEGSSGTYTISGGRLSTTGLFVGLAGSGTLNITGASANITASRILRFGPNSTFSAVAGSTIHMTGTAFYNSSTDPAALGGLANLRLIFKGGGADFGTVEVAGEDLGPVPAGWTDNFALGTLQLGGAGRIQLVDDADNQQDGPGNEALYVDRLIPNGGAKIDLNGLGLYFLNGGLPKQLFAGDANLDGCVDGLDYVTWSANYGQGGMAWKDADYNGDTVVDGLDYIAWSGNYLRGGPGGAGTPVPEPGAIGLILAGACLILTRRRA